MDDFIFFNQRLTEKLNAIYKYPFTIVNGGAGVGKTFSVRNYLETTGAEVIWHAAKEKQFDIYMREFIDNYAVLDSRIREEKPAVYEGQAPSDIAVHMASVIKTGTNPQRRVYLLEYMGANLPDEIFEFLFYLSNQRIKNLYVILSLRCGDGYRDKGYLDDSTNYIPEECFLLTPREIGYAFSKNGIALGAEEMQWLYLTSGGWISVIKAIYEEMKQQGKTAAYKNLERITERFFSLPDCDSRRNGRIDPKGMASLEEAYLPKLRDCIEKYDIEKGYLSLAKEELNAGKYTEEWDACVYYRTILLALEGKAKKAAELLDKEFSHRIQNDMWESAYRIFLAGLQYRVFLEDRWFDEEKEIIRAFAEMRISRSVGIPKRAAAMSLWLGKDYHLLIAFLETEGGSREDDLPYEKFLLAAACKEIGYTDEMERHLSQAWERVTETQNVLPALRFGSVFPNGDRWEDQEFRSKSARFRRIMRKNNDGYFNNIQKSLTVRESEIVDYLRKGLTNKEIAASLNISENTVKAALKIVYRKLGVTGRKELR